jgi:hypothetical protein
VSPAGLPAPPPGVLRLDVVGTIDRAEWMTGWWLFVSPESDLDLSQYQAMLSLLTLFSTTFISSVSSTNTRCSACRLALAFELVHEAPDNHGAWGDSLPGNEASAVTWLTGEGGRRGVATTYLPGFPGDFTDDSVTVNPTGVGHLESAANTFASDVNTGTAPPLHQLTLGVLHRVRAGTVLHPGEFAPALGVKAAQVISHRDSRLRAGALARF